MLRAAPPANETSSRPRKALCGRGREVDVSLALRAADEAVSNAQVLQR
jgi:hypothetical protein